MGRSIARKRIELEEKEAIIQQKLNDIPSKSKKRRFSIDELINITDATKFQNYWIRDPHQHKVRSANKERQIKDFVKWTFVKYPVPQFMYEAWPVPETEWDERATRRKHRFRQGHWVKLVHKDAKHWFVTLASGGSLYKTYMKGFMTKKEVHVFSTLNFPNMDIDQHLWIAKFICLGADKEHAVQLANTVIGKKDIDNKFWLDVARFFIVNNVRSNDMREILDCIVDVKKENKDFSMKGRTKQSVIRLSNDWHAVMARKKACKDRVWEGYAIPIWEHIENIVLVNGIKAKRLWKIEQIITERRLLSEGNNMGHCVASYISNCIKGSCAIFHVTCEDPIDNNSGLTIELSNNGKIHQIKGRHNRSPYGYEKNIIKRWAQENNLVYSINEWY